MPIRAFDDGFRNTSRLLDLDNRGRLGVDRSRHNQQSSRHNRISHNQRHRRHGLEREATSLLTGSSNDDKRNRSDVNGNVEAEGKQTVEGEDGTFHFHTNPLASFMPPPAYESRPSTPQAQRPSPSAPPVEQHETKLCMTPDAVTPDAVTNDVVTADHFQKIYGCKTATSIIVLIVAVILFGVFLALLILLA